MALHAVEEDEPQVPTPAQAAGKAGLQMILLGLQALSQKTIVAISNCFSILVFAVTAYLWFCALETMTTNQITGLSIFSLFVLGFEYNRRRK